MTAYLDASVLIPTIVREAGSVAVDRLLAGWSDTLMVSDFAAAEVASALSRLVRTGRITRDGAIDRLADFDVWRSGMTAPCELQASDARLAGAYVRRFELALRAPDAMHAAICRRLGLILMTLDRQLARAARELGIPVRIPDE